MPITISLSPNITRKDFRIILSYFLLPWKWFSLVKGKKIARLEKVFKDYFDITHAVSFDSGRSALLAVLKAMNIGEGDEVIVQAYTCIVVPNSVIFACAKPVYADIEKDGFNIDPHDFEKKITPRTRAVIIQNTFGAPADYQKIMKVAREKKIMVIEDCAHCLGGTYMGKKFGTFGDAAIFSFGRDKVISCIYGGMAVTNNEHIGEKLSKFQRELLFPSKKRVFSHLLQPIIIAISLPLYDFFKIGRGLIMLSQKVGIISKALLPCEKKGQEPAHQPAKLPNSLAEIAINQFSMLEDFNRHRREIALFYDQNLNLPSVKKPVLKRKNLDQHVSTKDDFFSKNEHTFLRYTISTPQRDFIMAEARKKGIYLGDWYDRVIAPKDSDLTAAQYTQGSCKNAEKAALETINLPTHPNLSKKDAHKIISFLNDVST